MAGLNFVTWVRLASCAWLLAAAVAGAAEPRAAPGSSPPMVWPPPPAEARVRYLRSISTATDWGITRGWFGRMTDVLTGRQDPHLVRPTGVAERDGALFVADPGVQALFIFDTTRRKQVVVTRLGDQALMSPVAVAAGPGGSVFLADSVLGQVFAVARDGKLQRVVIAQGLRRPAALAYDSSRRRLYVADSSGHRVHVYDADGHPLLDFGGNGRDTGRFNSPTHLAVTSDGSVLVTDALNHRVQVFDPSGRFLRSFGEAGDGAGNFAAPKGVAVDRLGHILVADAMFDAVQIFDDTGRLLLGFGEQGREAGQFWMPNGLCVGDADVLYVADAYNQRIQAFQLLLPRAPGDERP
jgi:DNA-binding beta-propeller fold protein YncE